MIGSHNTFTFFSPKHKFFNLFKWLWRCQDKTIDEQYKAGVRYFDIRLSPRAKGGYYAAHGLVTLNWQLYSIRELIDIMKCCYPNAKCRIILEKGSAADFIAKIINIVADNDMYLTLREYVHQIIIKDGWKIIYDNDWKVEIKDYSYVPRYSDKSFWYNLTHFKFDTIKHHSKSNPTITKEMIEDKNVVYFMDYIK